METKTNCQTTHTSHHPIETSHHDHKIETRGVSLKFLKWFTKYQVKPFFQRGRSQTDNWEIIEQLNQLDVADCIQKDEAQAKRLVNWFYKAKGNKDPMYLVTESGSRYVKVQSYEKKQAIKDIDDRKIQKHQNGAATR